MCLDMIDKVKPKNIGRVGWKVFSRGMQSGEYNFIFRQHSCKMLKRNKWLRRTITKIYCNDVNRKVYDSGFHLYLNKRDAAWNAAWSVRLDDKCYNIIKKVKFGSIVCTGWQEGYRVIVAKSIKIL